MRTLSVNDLAQQVGWSVRQIELLGDLLASGSGFDAYQRRKRSGGVREIVRPSRILDTATKNLQRSFLAELPYRPSESVHGFVRGRSSFTNASVHLGSSCVLRVDLEDFFPSISTTQVVEALGVQGYDDKAAELCAKIVTIERKLPIGLSTSPFLSNIVFESSDQRLLQAATNRNLRYTRYVDDLAFSPDPNDDDYSALSDILNADGWSINLHKTAFMRMGGPQYVTGLYVGDLTQPRLPRRSKRHMRWVMHKIVKFGYDTYMTDFGGIDEQMFPPQLRGYAYYYAGVEPNFGYPLIRLIEDHVPDAYRPDDQSDDYDYSQYADLEIESGPFDK